MFGKNNFVKAAVLLSAALFFITGCPQQPPDKGGVRAPVPDLKREIFVVNGLAETVSIVNPEAVLNPGGDIASGDYIDNGTMVDLTKMDIYNDALLVGKWPNHVLYYDGRLFVSSSGENRVEVYPMDLVLYELSDVSAAVGQCGMRVESVVTASTPYRDHYVVAVAGD